MKSLTKLSLFALVTAFLLLVFVVVLFWKRPLAVYAWVSRRELKREGLTKIFVESRVGPQTVWEGGQGPTVVVLHGAGDQAGTWSKVAPVLLHNYHVLIPDLAGHGESEPRSGPLSVGTILSGLEDLLNRPSIEGPPVLVGNSLGGWVAMLYALENPNRVARLVIVNGGGLQGSRKDLTLMPSRRDEARRLMDALRDPASLRVPDFVLDDVIREAHRGPIARLSSAADEMRQYLLQGRLKDLSTPVDFLWGESDKLLPPDYARSMAAELPASRITLISRCGHMPQQECPTAFSTALEKVLQGPSPQTVKPL